MRLRPLLGAGYVVVAVGLLALSVSVFHVSLYRITTDSMAPVFPAGTIVLDTAAQPLKKNSPITFTADGGTVTHVFVGYNPDGSLKTRGIANPANDVWTSAVFPQDVRGRVVFGVLLFAPSFWTGTRGLSFVAGVCLAILCLVLTRRIGRVPRAARATIRG